MTRTFLIDLSNDISRFRFHVGDTDVANAGPFEDETITALIASEGSLAKAIILGLQSLIAAMSKPNFTADWLQVDHSSARAGYETLLAEKRRQFGIARVTGRVQPVTRSD